MGAIVIVTGSRKWTDRRKLNALLDSANPGIVVHGGAAGADTMAHAWCKNNGRIAVVHFPDWNRVMKAALVRNVQMLETYSSALVLAFPFPDSQGTRHTIREAQARGMRVIISEGGQ